MPKKLKKSKKVVAKKKKTTVKKVVAKKAVKKGVLKKAAKKAGGGTAQKPVGVVTHFYTEISVAIVKFNKPVRVGAELSYQGATTDFNEVVKSMQYDHKPVATAPKGKQIGIKVKKRVRDGDLVYLA